MEVKKSPNRTRCSLYLHNPSERTTVLKSARQIGVSTISKDVLTVDEGACGWMFKNVKIGHVFDYSSTAGPRASKRGTVLKSARQIGVSTISKCSDCR